MASAEAGGGGGEEPVASPHRRKIARQSSGISDPVRSLALGAGTGSGQGSNVMERSIHKCIGDGPGHLCGPFKRFLSRQALCIGVIGSHAQRPKISICVTICFELLPVVLHVVIICVRDFPLLFTVLTNQSYGCCVNLGRTQGASPIPPGLGWHM